MFEDFKKLVQAAKNAAQDAQKLGENIQTVAQTVSPSVLPSIIPAITPPNNEISTTVGTLSSTVDTLSTTVDSLWSVKQGLVNNVSDTAKGFTDQIKVIGAGFSGLDLTVQDMKALEVFQRDNNISTKDDFIRAIDSGATLNITDGALVSLAKTYNLKDAIQEKLPQGIQLPDSAYSDPELYRMLLDKETMGQLKSGNTMALLSNTRMKAFISRYPSIQAQIDQKKQELFSNIASIGGGILMMGGIVAAGMSTSIAAPSPTLMKDTIAVPSTTLNKFQFLR